MDDMADLKRDIKTKHHNYVASLIFQGSGRETPEDLMGKVSAGKDHYESADILNGFSDVKNKSVQTARSYLEAGLSELFEEKHM